MGDFNWNGLFTRWMPGKKLFVYYGQSTTEDSQKKPARLVGKSYRKAGLPAEVIQAIEGIKQKTYRLHENAQRLSKALEIRSSGEPGRAESVAKGILPNVSDLHTLRSFCWTVGDYLKRTGAEYDRLSMSELTAIAKAVEDAGNLNYRGGSYFPGLCSTPDRNIYFLPSQLSMELKKTAAADGCAASLNRLRKDLTRIKPVMENLAMELFGGTAGAEKEFFETVLATWCTLAILAQEPFVLTDGRKPATSKAAVKKSAAKANAGKSDTADSNVAEAKAEKKAEPKKAKAVKPEKAEAKVGKTKAEKATVKKATAEKPEPKKAEAKKAEPKKSKVTAETTAKEEIVTAKTETKTAKAVKKATKAEKPTEKKAAKADKKPVAKKEAKAADEKAAKKAVKPASEKKVTKKSTDKPAKASVKNKKEVPEAPVIPIPEITESYLVAEVDGELVRIPTGDANKEETFEMLSRSAIPEAVLADAKKILPRLSEAGGEVDIQYLSKRLTELQEDGMANNDPGRERTVEELIAELMGTAQQPKEAPAPAPAPEPAPAAPAPAPVKEEVKPAPAPSPVEPEWEVSTNSAIKNDIEPEWEVSLVNPAAAAKPVAPAPVAPAPAAPVVEPVKPAPTPEEIAANAVIPEILPYIAPEPEAAPAPAAKVPTPEEIAASAANLESLFPSFTAPAAEEVKPVEPAPVIPEPAPVIPEPVVIPEPAPVIPEPALVVPEPAPEPVKPVSSIPDITPDGVKPEAATFETNQASQTEMDEHEAAVRRRMREILEQNKKKQQEKDEVRRQMEERRLEVARKQEQRRQEILAKRKADYEKLLAEQEDLRKVVEENKNAIMGDRKKKRTEAQRRIMDIEDIILKEYLDLKRGTNDYHTGLTQELY